MQSRSAPVPLATSLNRKSNTSCSRKAPRSSGDSRSSVKSNATDKSSASSVWLSGASAAMLKSALAAGTDVLLAPCARRAQHVEANARGGGRRNALWSNTLSRSARCQRKYVSCTASLASAIDPSMRYARPSRRRRYGSKLAAGFDIVPLMPDIQSRSAGTVGTGQSQPTGGHADEPHDHGDAPPRLAHGRCRDPPLGGDHDQPTRDQADRPQHQGHDGPVSPLASADTTGGAGQSQPTDDRANQRNHGSHRGPRFARGSRYKTLTAGGSTEAYAAAGAASPTPPTRTAAASRSRTRKAIHLIMSLLLSPTVRRDRASECDMPPPAG